MHNFGGRYSWVWSEEKVLDLRGYKQVHRLAIGGMAEVFVARAVDEHDELRAHSEPLVVVKRILPHLKEDKRFVEMFLREATLSSAVKHPNIIDIYDAIQSEDDYIIVMEYVSGLELRSIFELALNQKFRVPVPVVCRIIADSLAGLEAAHCAVDNHGRSLGIVHRDIAPNNILVSFTGVAKVIDFGIAESEAEGFVTVEEEDSNTIRGNFHYISPEQLQDGSFSVKSDLFSMGVVLWELLTGKKLFWGDSIVSVFAKVLEDRIPPPSTYNPGVSAELDDVVMSALERDPKKRISSARTMRDTLLNCIMVNGVDSHWVGAWLRNQLAATYHERLELERLMRGTPRVVRRDVIPPLLQSAALSGI